MELQPPSRFVPAVAPSIIAQLGANFILNSDSYKYSHVYQYPDGTETVFSYIESRGGQYDRVVMFGIQAYLIDYLSKPITQAMIDEAEMIVTAHGEPFYREGWEYILKTYSGYLPLKVRAVREGTVVPTKNILCSVENTDPKCFWLTSFVETSILRAIWYGVTVSTQSWTIKNLIKGYLAATGTEDAINFKLHDFGARGVSSLESAVLGGMAHMVNFYGSDTLIAVAAAMRYYPDTQVSAFSIPASEHSTFTIRGREGEYKQFRRMFDKFAKPGAMFACVSDSYNIMKAVEYVGTELQPDLIASGATLVVRPDSGIPHEVALEVVKALDSYFGTTVNSKGFKVLPPCIRVIYGDGINEHSIDRILSNLMNNGYSADNIVFGMGGALLQQINRDTQRFAMKASAVCINGEWTDVYKDPIGDSGKTSKKGRMSLFKSRLTGEIWTCRIDQGPIDSEWEDMMVIMYENGQLFNLSSFAAVRERADKASFFKPVSVSER